MPKYDYRCSECQEIFEISHSYREKQTECIKCGALNTLSRLVSTPINIRKGKLPTTNSGRKTGAIVEEEIEKAKKEIKKSQQDLKSRKK